MHKKMGRPKKVSTELKLQIIDHFLITECAEDGRVVQQHGIYSKLAIFAKGKGYNLEPHDFSRDTKVKAYLQRLANTEVSENLEGFPVYEPLDIAYVVNKPRSELSEILKGREVYFQDLYRRAVAAIDRFDSVAASNRILLEQTEKWKQQAGELTDRYQCIEKAFREVEKENEYLRRFIKKELTPERADIFFKSLLTQEQVMDLAIKTATLPIRELTRDDSNLFREAEKAAGVGSIIELFIRREENT